jgi:hypothetical protein
MSLIIPISQFLNRRPYLAYLVVFIVSISLFAYLQSDPTFADPDSFYHAKMAELLIDQGATTQFPWLTATDLQYRYVDHHFLYHLALVPFAVVFGSLLGLKIATILFASLMVVVFYWFLRRLKVVGALGFTLFLLTINPFIFRLNLAKAQALVLIVLLLALYLLFTRRYLALLLVSFFYVWLYAGWPLLLGATILFLILTWLLTGRQTDWLIFKKLGSTVNRQNIGLLFSVVIGLLAGLFFNPYFPNNLAFYWQQTVQIGLVNYQYLIDVGGEWYPYKVFDLLLAAAPFFVVFAIALIVFLGSVKRQSVQSWFFLIMTALFLLLTLKSRRNVEYLIPVALIFSALSLTIWWRSVEKIRNRFKPGLLFLVGLVVVALPIFYRDITAVKDSYQRGFGFTHFSEPALWLVEHTPANSIIFHSDWDEFPFLFLYNDHNRYIVGLDPSFMYSYDKDLHQKWVGVTTGQITQDLYLIIKNLFGADYVFVDLSSNQAFANNLANNIHFSEVFANQESRIYQVVQ